MTIIFICFTRYSVIIPPDGAFGAELPNGTWTGMVGMIQSEVCQLPNVFKQLNLFFLYPIQI